MTTDQQTAAPLTWAQQLTEAMTALNQAVSAVKASGMTVSSSLDAVTNAETALAASQAAAAEASTARDAAVAEVTAARDALVTVLNALDVSTL